MGVCGRARPGSSPRPGPRSASSPCCSSRGWPHGRAVVAALLAATAAAGVAVLWSASGGPVPLVVLGAVLGLIGNLAGAGTVHAVVVDRVPWAVGRAIGIMSAGYF